ncbi:MAG: G1 family endopeptidase [Chloroflexi bacterium]|nr:G1 family endopeptidase [Chloroflexota bacterium]
MSISTPARWKTAAASFALPLFITAAVAIPSSPKLSPALEMGPDAATTATLGNSQNWAGYAATASTYTAVSGMWIVPQVSSTGQSGADATWVGIGGVTRNDLIQTGTQSMVDSTGQVSTTAFIETLPAASHRIPVTVNSGDSVAVSVAHLSSNQWQFTFSNKTNGQTYNTTVSYASSRSSAEWIEEDPSSRGRLLPLDSFGTVQFTGGLTTDNGNPIDLAKANAQAITMVDAGCQALATPSVLGGDGASFSITRSDVTPLPAYDEGPRGWRRDGRGVGNPIPFPRTIPLCPSSTTSSTPATVTTPQPQTNYSPWPPASFWGRYPFFGRRGTR